MREYVSNLAPILLFVFNRPEHTQKTIQSLKKNELAPNSRLFIYSDAAKDKHHEINVEKVRSYIKNIDGFKDITIIENDYNLGLATSVITGVTNIVKEFGKIIVLEDDLVTSPYFLNFMNASLDYYRDENKVWHISGWNYPFYKNNCEDVFFWRLMNCWGWATWSDRWEFFEKNSNKIIKDFSTADIRRFNIDDTENFWNQVLENDKGKINTWAIFWYAVIFKQNGLCLNPYKSFVLNIGNDGSGTHSAYTNDYNSELCMSKNINIHANIIESGQAIDELKEFFKKNKKNLWKKIVGKFLSHIK